MTGGHGDRHCRGSVSRHGGDASPALEGPWVRPEGMADRIGYASSALGDTKADAAGCRAASPQGGKS